MAQAIIVSCLLLAGVAFLFMISVSGSQPVIVVEDGSILVIDMGMNINDSPPAQSLDDAINEALGGGSIPSVYLLELIDAIDTAGYDDRVTGIFLHGELLPDGMGSGLAAISEVRAALQRFQETGKPIYAYMVDPSMKDYYLMSVADTVYMNPFGLISLNGLSAEGVYFGDAFKKYGIGVQATRVGKYKSAVEMFTGNSMSEADKEQLSVLIDGLWDKITTDISDARGVSLPEIMKESNAQGFFIGSQAKTLGLADEVVYFDEVIDQISNLHIADEELDSFRQVNLTDYIGAHGFRSEGPPLWTTGPKIAVLYAEGEIVDGEGYYDQIGGDHLSRMLRQLRNDDEVAAIVLRVNSPGGSAIASELIQREVREAKEKKPVIVSMGSMAASGGYWISAYANQIFAEQATITGSIGVFGLVPNVQGLANDHGVTFDGVKTSQFADLYTLSRPKTPEEMALIQQYTDHLYDEFIRKVSEGRSLPLDQVQQIAQGRVWSGLDAKDIGLVDQIGGLTEAIDYAAEAANLDVDWVLIQLPEPRTLAETLVETLSTPPGAPPVTRISGNDVLSATLRRLQKELAILRGFNDPRNVYARLPFSLEIQ